MTDAQRHSLTCVVAFVLAGCTGSAGSDAGPADAGEADTGADAAPADAGPDGGGDAGARDAGPPDAAVSPAVRGEYLVKHVALCPSCHTPRDGTGAPDATRFLAGDPVRPFVDTVPGDATMGAVYVRNITPDDASGIGLWTDTEIENAFLDGVDGSGSPLYPGMPYWVFHNMSPEDATAIVAYLRTVPPVAQTIPENQVLAPPLTAAASPVPEAAIPHTTLPSTDPLYARAEHGRYLAADVGICISCHTAPSTATAVPVDVAMLFAGNRAFPTAELGLGLTVPPWADTIYSANITPHAHGIAGWTPADVQRAVQMDVDRTGGLLCPPMPGGAGGLGMLTDADALDIGYYLTTLPPVDSGIVPACTPVAGWHP